MDRRIIEVERILSGHRMAKDSWEEILRTINQFIMKVGTIFSMIWVLDLSLEILIVQDMVQQIDLMQVANVPVDWRLNTWSIRA